MVLKLVRHSERGHPMWLSGEDISHWYYWRRELPAYTSGLLDQLSGAMLHAVQDARPTLNRRPLADAVRWWAPVLGFLVRIGAEALG